MRDALERLFCQAGVDFIVQSHIHNYERILPVYQHQVYPGSPQDPYDDPPAPCYVVAGYVRVPRRPPLVLTGLSAQIGRLSRGSRPVSSLAPQSVECQTHLALRRRAHDHYEPGARTVVAFSLLTYTTLLPPRPTCCLSSLTPTKRGRRRPPTRSCSSAGHTVRRIQCVPSRAPIGSIRRLYKQKKPGLNRKQFAFRGSHMQVAAGGQRRLDTGTREKIKSAKTHIRWRLRRPTALGRGPWRALDCVCSDRQTRRVARR